MVPYEDSIPQLYTIAAVNPHPLYVAETCEGDVEHLMADLSAARVAFHRWAAWIAACRRNGLAATRKSLFTKIDLIRAQREATQCPL